jgi:WD40 repeat protein
VLRSDIDYECENTIIKRDPNQTNAIDWNLLSKYKKDTAVYPYHSTVNELQAMQYYEAPVRTVPPDTSLHVDWIYGYQAEKARNNVRYNFEGDVVYHVSKYVIVYNFVRHQQRIFTGHSEEVISLCMHPEGKLCASGDQSPKPRLLVWHTVTKEILFIDKTFHRNGVLQVAFSGNLNPNPNYNL